MNSLTYFIYIILGISLLISHNLSANLSTSPSTFLATKTQDQQDKLPRIRGFTIPIKVKLISYEVTAKQINNYADISLSISNPSRKTIKVEIIQITVVVAGSNQVFLSAAPQELGASYKIAIEPGESRVLEYHLQSVSIRSQRKQKVIAVIRYRQDEKPESVALSYLEQVAVRNR